MANRVIIVTLPVRGSSPVQADAVTNIISTPDVVLNSSSSDTEESPFQHFYPSSSTFHQDNNYPGNNYYGALDLENRFLRPKHGYHIDSSHRGRRRQRLTHLTPQEKLNRRKFKNRIAAHLARERRKTFLVDLERRYKRIKYENGCLKARNTQIKQNIDRLSIENELLRKQIVRRQTLPRNSVVEVESTSTEVSSSCGPVAQVSEGSRCVVNIDGGSVESAAFISKPQQQDWVPLSTCPPPLVPSSEISAAIVETDGHRQPKTKKVINSLANWLLTLTMMAASSTDSTELCESSFQSLVCIMEQQAMKNDTHKEWARATLEKLTNQTLLDQEQKKRLMLKLIAFIQRKLGNSISKI